MSDIYKQKDSSAADGGVVNSTPHLYGELAKTEVGFSILVENVRFKEILVRASILDCKDVLYGLFNLFIYLFFFFLKESIRDDSDMSIRKRAALWAAGHVGASENGLQYLMKQRLLDVILDIAGKFRNFCISSFLLIFFSRSHRSDFVCSRNFTHGSRSSWIVRVWKGNT